MRVLLACLAAFLLSGCFVFDELDSGMAIMEAHSPADKKAKKAAESQPKEGEKPPTYAEKTSEWWGKASTLSPEPETATENPTVTCKVSNRSFYTKQSDCLARGGRPG